MKSTTDLCLDDNRRVWTTKKSGIVRARLVPIDCRMSLDTNMSVDTDQNDGEHWPTEEKP